MPHIRLQFIIPVAFLLIGVWFFLTKQGFLTINVEQPGQQQQLQTGPTPTPTPTALKEGKEAYTISQAAGTPGPKISSLSLDPLDPKVNETQTISAHITYDQPVSNVSIEFISDNKTRTLSLTLGNGTVTNGDWQTTWAVDDTILYRYIMNISASGGGVKNTVQVAPRQ